MLLSSTFFLVAGEGLREWDCERVTGPSTVSISWVEDLCLCGTEVPRGVVVGGGGIGKVAGAGGTDNSRDVADQLVGPMTHRVEVDLEELCQT